MVFRAIAAATWQVLSRSAPLHQIFNNPHPQSSQLPATTSWCMKHSHHTLLFEFKCPRSRGWPAAPLLINMLRHSVSIVVLKAVPPPPHPPELSSGPLGCTPTFLMLPRAAPLPELLVLPATRTNRLESHYRVGKPEFRQNPSLPSHQKPGLNPTCEHTVFGKHTPAVAGTVPAHPTAQSLGGKDFPQNEQGGGAASPNRR